MQTTSVNHPERAKRLPLALATKYFFYTESNGDYNSGRRKVLGISLVLIKKNGGGGRTRTSGTGLMGPMLPLKKRLLTVEEASLYLGRSLSSVRELIWSGDLPFVKAGRRTHLDIYDLDKWIEQHKVTNTY